MDGKTALDSLADGEYSALRADELRKLILDACKRTRRSVLGLLLELESSWEFGVHRSRYARRYRHWWKPSPSAALSSLAFEFRRVPALGLE